MARWSDRVEELLYEGERVDEQVDVGSATVVVTSHRVLAFTPESDGANFQQVDRPNVTSVALRTEGKTTFLKQGARAALYGIVLVAAGLLLPIDSILGGVGLPRATGRLGIGGVLGLFRTMLNLLRNLDDMLQLIGGLLLLFAVVPMGVYLWSREQALVIDLAGEDDPIRMPVPEADGEAIADRLETAILPEGVSSDPRGRLESLLG